MQLKFLTIYTMFLHVALERIASFFTWFSVFLYYFCSVVFCYLPVSFIVSVRVMKRLSLSQKVNFGTTLQDHSMMYVVNFTVMLLYEI